MIREMREEAGVLVEGRPSLVSVHANERFFRVDHVLVYRIDPAALPEDTHRATRARLAEMFGGREVSDPEW